MASWRPTGAPRSLVLLRPPFILFTIWDTATVSINPLCCRVGSAPRPTLLFTFIRNSRRSITSTNNVYGTRRK